MQYLKPIKLSIYKIILIPIISEEEQVHMHIIFLSFPLRTKKVVEQYFMKQCSIF